MGKLESSKASLTERQKAIDSTTREASVTKAKVEAEEKAKTAQTTRDSLTKKLEQVCDTSYTWW